MTNFSANFLTNCSFGEQFANLNELYIWYARTEQLCREWVRATLQYYRAIKVELDLSGESSRNDRVALTEVMRAYV